ncbi:MAG TPA: hypothetical protein VFD17_04410 [Clostridia bacterium]|nr:hypothetical protein [Clostridia bacterium]
MKLHNCYSEKEKKLKETNLVAMMDHEIVELADGIRKDYRDGVLQDPCVVVDALHQIVEEQANRIRDARFDLNLKKRG